MLDPKGRSGRVLKSRLVAHIETCRPYTLTYAGLVSLAGALLASGEWETWRLLGAWAAPTLGWLAALYGGDFFDRHLDALAKPHRPIPSGRMRARTALTVMVVSIVLGMVLAVLLNPLNLVVAAVTLLLGLSYNNIFKARGALGNGVRGALTALAFVFGTMATSQTPPLELLPLALVFWLHDAGSNLVGALRDVDGDRTGGYQTLPVRRGVATTLRVAAVLYASWLVWAVVYPAVVDLRFDFVAYALFLGAAALLGLVSLLILLRAPRPIPRLSALRAHEVLVVERLVLASALVAAAEAQVLALAFLASCTAMTVVSQHLLRRRYEFAPSAVEDDGAEGVGADEIVAFVDGQVRRLNQSAHKLRSIASWSRRLHIEVSDLRHAVYLIVGDGSIKRVEAAQYDASNLTPVRITTTSTTFAGIFLTGRTNPRRAYLARQIRIDGTSRDMLRLNHLFNEFRQVREAPPGQARVFLSDDAPLQKPAIDEQLGPSIVISDTTLRDGEQMPGVAFSIDEKVEMARRLDALGVPLIEVGFPIVSREEAVAVEEIVALDLNAVTQVIARPTETDIEAAVGTGAQSIALFIGTSDVHVFDKLRTTRVALVGQVERAISLAKQSGCQVVFAAEDATRTPVRFLLETYAAAAAAGADAVGIADTAGIATPQLMASLVRQANATVDVPVAVHCHNDLGLATANSLAALLAGASGVQCSLLGMGERAGNAALEEVALALEVAHDFRTGLDILQLPSLTNFVAQVLGYTVPPNKAVVGSNAFAHESGLHLDGVVRNPSAYEPYPPEIVGRQRRFFFGKHSGRGGIVEVLEKHHILHDDEFVRRLVHEVKKRGQAKRPLDEQGLVCLARRPPKAASKRQDDEPVVV